MQPLALCEAAMAVCYGCECSMQHASEMPIWHLGEVTSRPSRRPPAASAHKSKTTVSTTGMDSRLPATFDTISSESRFRIHLDTCSVSDVL